MTLPHVSASSVDLYRSCHRKWVFQKVCNIQTPASSAQARGTKIHAVLEQYLRDGSMPPVSSAIDTGIPLYTLVDNIKGKLPSPGSDLLVEYPFKLPTYSGGPGFVGFIDLINPRGPTLDIWDHKTTSNFKYAKTPEELLQNTQMMAYAYAGYYLPELPTFKNVTVTHHYISTQHKSGRSVVVTADVPQEHAEEQWAGIVRDTRAMQAEAHLPEYVHAPDDATRADLALSITPGNPDSCGMYGGCFFRDKCPEAQSFVSIGRLFSSKPNQGDIMSTSSIEELKARLAAKMASSAVPVTPPVANPTPSAEAQSILPPDCPPRVDDVSASPSSESLPPVPVKRGRPKGPSAPFPGKYIYIDSFPVAGPHATFVNAWITWMAELLLKLHGELKVLDYRLVDFGKGRGALSAFIRAQLDTMPEVCVVDSSHPEASDFLSAALPKAEFIIRGRR